MMACYREVRCLWPHRKGTNLRRYLTGVEYFGESGSMAGEHYSEESGEDSYLKLPGPVQIAEAVGSYENR